MKVRMEMLPAGGASQAAIQAATKSDGGARRFTGDA